MVILLGLLTSRELSLLELEGFELLLVGVAVFVGLEEDLVACCWSELIAFSLNSTV